MRQDTPLKAEYKKSLQKSVVAKAKHDATKPIYDELDTKEGQLKICKIAKARQSSRQDKMAVNVIKDRDGTILTDEKLIQERWKSYFEDLLNWRIPEIQWSKLRQWRDQRMRSAKLKLRKQSSKCIIT